MKYFADLHIHSRFSRATSKSLTLPELDLWAQKKGIVVMGTGDFTHPEWLSELKAQLIPAQENGLFVLKEPYAIGHKPYAAENATRFVLSVEVSSIYSKANKTRKIHTIVIVPSFEAAEAFNAQLTRRGANLRSDGRPIMGIDAKDIARAAWEAHPDALVVPAHCLLPDSILHTKGDFLKRIEDVQKGDLVLTHKNRWRRVEKIFTRPFRGRTYRIRPYYFRDGLTVTPEHPFYVIKTKKNCAWGGGICKPQHAASERCQQKSFQQYKPEWRMASQLEVGDVLVYPRFKGAFVNHSVIDVRKVIGVSSLESRAQQVRFPGQRSRYLNSKVRIDERFCRLAGYFLAEGYTNGRDAIGFTLHADEANYVEDITCLVREVFGFGGDPKIRQFSSQAIEVTFYSKMLNDLFARLFYTDPQRRGAASKVMPEWMLGLRPELQVEVFRGWWRGDRGYTVSRVLMNQMKIILLRLGIVPSIYSDSVEAYEKRGKHHYRGRQIHARARLYALIRLAFFEDSFGLLSEPEFAHFRTKGPVRHGWIDDQYVYLPIRDIEVGDYVGEVYNLEVEDDNSYVTEFATVHNCWTPWFSVFGSMSGFDSLEECFEELTPKIFAIETGLSSDPPMNWRVSALDNVALMSNSDSHSARKIGREANEIEGELSYTGLLDAFRTGAPVRVGERENVKAKLIGTVEFFPEEGKYHYDGHRLCKVRWTPQERKTHDGRCSVCGRAVTVGVVSRVDDLADREEGFRPEGVPGFRSLVPLEEIIAESLDVGTGTKKSLEHYERLVAAFGNEFSVLLDTPIEGIAEASLPIIGEGVRRVRKGKLYIEPGYDGEFGTVHVFTGVEREHFAKGGGGQPSLF